MERLKELISQLLEQADQKAEPSRMLQTTQQIEAELRSLAAQPAPGRVMPTKIAVMMPSAAKIPSVAEAPAKTIPDPAAGMPAKTEISTKTEIAAKSEMPAKATANGSQPVNGSVVPAPIIATAVAAPPRTKEKEKDKETERGVWPFDPLAEKPTDRFTLSQKSREINDIIANSSSTSRNEKLKTDITDLRSALNDTPIRDLKKAIGVNDRYLFVSQLFRGDEAMYERSIKTINGFRILPEAEYWMERELKVKLGWDENRDVTRHFYQLVKRRFS
jgi:hypothetical protein